MLGNVYAKQRHRGMDMHARNLSSFKAEAKGAKRGLAKDETGTLGIDGSWKIVIVSC